MLKQIFMLTRKKIEDNLDFSLKTVTFFVAPLLWIFVFLFLRKAKTTMTLPNGIVPYATFLILGVSMWRGVSQLLRDVTNSLIFERNTLRVFLRMPKGKDILFYSTVLSSLFLSLLVTLTLIVVGIIFFDFTINFHMLWLALIVFFISLLANTGLSFILLSLSAINRDLRNIRYLITSVFALLSGVFFPVVLYPSPFNWIALSLPFTQGVVLIQNLLLFENPVFNVKIFVILIIEAIILWYLGYKMFKKNINKSIK